MAWRKYGRGKRGNPIFGIILLAALIFFFAVEELPALLSGLDELDDSFGRKSVAESAYSVPQTEEASVDAVSYTYVLNTNTKRIHKPECSSVYEMADHNRQRTNKSVAELEAEGYVKCQRCFGG